MPSKTPKIARFGTIASLFLLVAAFSATADAQARKEFRYTLAPGGTITLSNQRGAINVHPGAGRQVVIQATLPSSDFETDSHQAGNRIDVHTHNLLKLGSETAKVDYDVAMPADVGISVDLGVGTVNVENLRSNVVIEVDDGSIEVRGVGNGSVQVQTMNGLVTLADIRNSRVQVTSTGGNVVMDSVTGPLITVKSATGNIRYYGDFSGGGSYKFQNHSGDIEVRLPSTSSVELTARSVKGSVENDFPFRAPEHTSFTPKAGRSFAGTSLTGASSVELHSFSGTIRVKKQ